MAKRLTGTNKWDKAWFRKLSPRHKALWQFLCDRCDQAGMWEIDLDSASHYINDVKPITEADLKIFGDRVERYNQDKLWIVDFVDFQCGELSQKSPAHKPVFKLLNKYGLLDRVLHRLPNTQQEIEVEIEREKEGEEEKEKEKPRAKKDSRETPDFSKPDVEGDELIFPLDTKAVRELWAAWKKKRWEKYNLRYGMMSEQADLKRLEGMTFGQIEATILAAISAEWKNLYPDKSQSNGKSGAGTNKKQEHTRGIFQSISNHYGPKLTGDQGKPDV